MQYYLTDIDYKIAYQNGISKSLLEQRINRDLMSIEQARTQPPRQSQPTYWNDYKSLATSNGISYTTYLSRIRNQNMTPYEASTTPLIPPIVKNQHRRKIYLTDQQEQQRINNNISMSLLYKRLKKMPVDEAVSHPPLSPRESALKANSKWRTFNTLYSSK